MRLEADWLLAEHSRLVMDALDGQGFFVGGCVRNALLAEPVSDIDVATPFEPDAVLERLKRANIKAIPTGLQHGTVTAVHLGVPVEITTFRKDVETDGRHAVVAYTQDIAQDAARRDFTVNALYADRHGTLIDPLNGLPDLEARMIRFIGNAHDRIREDYLRILRFFRFHAWYGRDGLDGESLSACAELADGIEGLARERVGWEFRKLLSAPDPAPALASMEQAGILWRCLAGADAAVLAVLVHLEQQFDVNPDWLRRLVGIGGSDAGVALRLSRIEERMLGTIREAVESGESDQVTAYRHGQDIAVSAALIRAASTGGTPSTKLATDIALGSSAKFPLKAKHLLARGVEPGPTVGTLLRDAESKWIASGFSLDKEMLLSDLLS